MNITQKPIPIETKAIECVEYGSLVAHKNEYWLLLDSFPQLILANIKNGKTIEIDDDTLVEIIDHEIILK